MSTLLASLVYVDRGCPHLHIGLEQWALERVFLGALIVASKYLNDSTLKNLHWALCTGIFGKRDVGRIEREYLDVLNFELKVTEDDLLSSAMGMENAPPEIQPSTSGAKRHSSDAENSSTQPPEPPIFSESVFSPPDSTDSNTSTDRHANDAGNAPPPESPPSGSTFPGAKNIVISGGKLTACHSADQRTMIAVHNVNTPSNNMLSYSLVGLHAAITGVHMYSNTPHIAHRPLLFGQVMLYCSPLPIYYDDLPIFVAPLLFLYLWRFVFGVSSRAAG